MAKLMLLGDVADVELTSIEDEDGFDAVVATCMRHTGAEMCAWTERYDDMSDATEYAADHADTGKG